MVKKYACPVFGHLSIHFLLNRSQTAEKMYKKVVFITKGNTVINFAFTIDRFSATIVPINRC